MRRSLHSIAPALALGLFLGLAFTGCAGQKPHHVDWSWIKKLPPDKIAKAVRPLVDDVTDIVTMLGGHLTPKDYEYLTEFRIDALAALDDIAAGKSKNETLRDAVHTVIANLSPEAKSNTKLMGALTIVDSVAEALL